MSRLDPLACRDYVPGGKIGMRDYSRRTERDALCMEQWTITSSTLAFTWGEGHGDLNKEGGAHPSRQGWDYRKLHTAP